MLAKGMGLRHSMVVEPVAAGGGIAQSDPLDLAPWADESSPCLVLLREALRLDGSGRHPC
jgi:hypothetical protein